MRLSLAYEMQRPVVDDHAVVEETIEQCVLADRMGFDTVWFVELVESWGGVPEHLRANFARYIKTEGTEGAPVVDLSGGSGQIASALWNQIDADTLVQRGVLVAGDPESCLRSIAVHEAAGVDELQFLMATETIPHERVMSSIELFGKHVIPEL
jgi:alkanesulfonate monooxygenase SsuD/methylene tetrahydromethanopterin reductase-like flavin-dependent oxidoreductase (luciferase family)